MKKMNLLYLHSHDTGRYIQPYGYPVRTPSLQKLAEQGVVFRDAHCVGPTCSPSRAGLLTGECAHSSGMVALAHRGGTLKHPERHLATTLRRNGYRSLLCGVEHVGSIESCGYEILDRDGNEGTADAAVKFLMSKPDKPFFLDAGFTETHRIGKGFSSKNDCPRDGASDDRFLRPPSILPDSPEMRRDWADWCISLDRLDGYYGRILAALEESGLAGNTVVIATTDHGIAFPDMKCKLTNHGTGVLLIMKGPEKTHMAGGKVSDALVSHLDVYPTICDLLGLSHPAWLQGRSVMPLAKGEKKEIREQVFSEVTFHAAFEPKRSVRTKRWNYIRNFLKEPLQVMPNCDAGISKDTWVGLGWKERAVPREELYDLVLDPMERNNLAAKPESAEVLADMRKRIARWMKDTDDVLLKEDPSCLPEELVVNPWSSPNPDKDSAIRWDRNEWELIERD